MSKKWYAAQTYSGYENSVKQDLDSRIKSYGMQDKIYQVIVPEEEQETVRKDGTKVKKMVKMFPGYIFIQMEVDKDVDEKAWFMVRNTPKVTGFLGSSGGGTKPVPIPTEEMNDILLKIGKLEKPVYDYQVGDKVNIISGSFTGQVGEIASVNFEREIATVLVTFFGGRPTPMELKFTEFKK